VGGLIEGARFKAALAEAMRISSLANQYVAEQAPWALVKTDRDRAATVLYVALQAVDSLKTMLAPFLPFTAQVVHELLGYDGWIAGPIEFRTVVEEDGSSHEVLTGDYASWVGAWQPSELPRGQALREPRPLFRKLAPEVVDEELARLEQ
jgi:methionyl-tRNA synthetase